MGGTYPMFPGPRRAEQLPSGSMATGSARTRRTAGVLAWYSPREFAAREPVLAVPTTWAELEALTAAITESGTPPWCLGIRDGGVTGWVATDWGGGSPAALQRTRDVRPRHPWRRDTSLAPTDLTARKLSELLSERCDTREVVATFTLTGEEGAVATR